MSKVTEVLIKVWARNKKMSKVREVAIKVWSRYFLEIGVLQISQD